MTITIRTHLPRGAAGQFYPVTKFYAVVTGDAPGLWLGATGYCKTREAARRAGERLIAKLEG
jgi:hypothetical protein